MRIHASTGWQQTHGETGTAVTRLYCFPCAGGAAGMFRTWAKSLPPQIQVQTVELPGRGARSGQAPIGDYRTLVQDLASRVLADFRETRRVHPFLRYAIFGHSAGARFGFSVAATMAAELPQTPARCFLSGSGAPHAALQEPRLLRLSDAQWISELRALEGPPFEGSTEAEGQARLMAVLHADLSASKGSHADSSRRLNCPFTLFAGQSDVEVSEQEVWNWERYTKGDCRRVVLQGDHFSMMRDPTPILLEIQKDLGVAPGLGQPVT